MEIPEYKGPLHAPIMEPLARKALETIVDQRRRCSNPKNSGYKTYGAKGIKVEYTSRQFIAWYLENIKKFKGKKPSVGRIDHSKNYTFDNIEIQSCSDNAKERCDRLGAFNYKGGIDTKIPVVVYLYRTMEPIVICDSFVEAARVCRASRTAVSAILRGEYKSVAKKKFTFKRLSDTEFNQHKQ